jgi:cell division protein FtsW
MSSSAVSVPNSVETEAEVSATAPGIGWDWPLFTAVAGLASFGLLMILSASSLAADEEFRDALHYVTRQVVGLGLGVAGAAAIVWMPYAWLRRGAWPLYGFTLLMLIAVFSPLGYKANGAVRWVNLGFFNFQPSELAKLALVLIVADYLARNEGRLKDVLGVVVPGLSLLVPFIAMMAFQRDFGTTVILLGLSFVLLYVGGLQHRWLALGGSVALAGLAVLIAIEPYRITRLTSFLDPYADVEGSGYQVVNGWIALSAGGISGKGLASGVAQRGFLPEAHTDFISAVVGEELGAVGWVALVAVYAFVVWRGMKIASAAPDLFGLLASVGVTVMLAAQALINLGVVCGLMPAKGLVLPFMSYGASAALVHSLCVAVLLRVSRERPLEAPVAAPELRPGGR